MTSIRDHARALEELQAALPSVAAASAAAGAKAAQDLGLEASATPTAAVVDFGSQAVSFTGKGTPRVSGGRQHAVEAIQAAMARGGTEKLETLT